MDVFLSLLFQCGPCSWLPVPFAGGGAAPHHNQSWRHGGVSDASEPKPFKAAALHDVFNEGQLFISFCSQGHQKKQALSSPKN
jgi:hypothetical protein